MEGYAERQFVGIDLHRRRSVIVRMTAVGERLETVRIDNDPVALALEIAKAGPDPEVAGRGMLEDLPLDPVYRGRVNSLLRLIDSYGFEIAAVSTRLTAQLARKPGYQALLTLPGVGPVLPYARSSDIGVTCGGQNHDGPCGV